MAEFTSRIALGTAQFGLNYGINNTDGRVSKNEITSILNEAKKYGIQCLDTAAVYGESEVALGSNDLSSFNIISKVPRCEKEEIFKLFEKSIESLQVSQLYGYLFHDFGSFLEGMDKWSSFQQLRSEGKVKKIGFSLYHVDEVDQLLDHDIDLDIVQIPYNVLDRRFESKFEMLKELGIEIHVRSVFLQGLLFKDPNSLEGKLKVFSETLKALSRIENEGKYSIQELALNFVYSNPMIDQVVIGVDRLSHFHDNLAAIDLSFDKTVIEEIKQIPAVEKEMLIPSNW